MNKYKLKGMAGYPVIIVGSEGDMITIAKVLAPEVRKEISRADFEAQYELIPVGTVIKYDPKEVKKTKDVWDLEFDIGAAVHGMELGHKVARKGWNGKGMWLELQSPDKHSKMTLPYIYIKTADGNLVPWQASQTDILAKDWVVVHD